VIHVVVRFHRRTAQPAVAQVHVLFQRSCTRCRASGHHVYQFGHSDHAVILNSPCCCHDSMVQPSCSVQCHTITTQLHFQHAGDVNAQLNMVLIRSYTQCSQSAHAVVYVLQVLIMCCYESHAVEKSNMLQQLRAILIMLVAFVV
jgi:hypothetical protein